MTRFQDFVLACFRTINYLDSFYHCLCQQAPFDKYKTTRYDLFYGLHVMSYFGILHEGMVWQRYDYISANGAMEYILLS